MKKLPFLILFAMLIGFAFAHFAHAQSTLQPTIQTSSTPNGTSLTIQFPQGYSGEVTSSYDGSKWTTQTEPLSQQQITAISNQVAKQQQEMNQFFAQQQTFFEQQQQFLNSFWTGL